MTSATLSDADRAREISRIAAAHSGREGALLPLLHEIQAVLGFVPAEAVGIVAEALNLSRAEIRGVIGFYHDFRDTAPDRPVVRLCRAEACQARGAEALVAQAEADPRIASEAVYCLGLCASGPAAMIGERIVARLDAARLDRLVEEAVR